MKYIIRLLVILLLSAMIKGFDHSFNGFWDFGFRSWFFVLNSLLYWMACWEIGSFLLRYFERMLIPKIKFSGRSLILTLIISIYTGGIVFLFNLFYRWWDSKFFGMRELWSSVPFPHPDLIYPLFILIMLIYFTNRFNEFNIQLKDAELYTSRLKQENISTKYQVLKSQVDPHFFFNSLSVLSSMIYTDIDLSAKYIYNLSKLYRYILEQRDHTIVALSKELEMIDAYIFLMKIRHQEGLVFNVKINYATADEIGMHQNSLQLLVENCIKHNVFTPVDPLVVEIYEDGTFICVRNQLKKRKLLGASTGVGLENIKARYLLYDHAKVQITEDNGFFTVKLPKLKISGK